MRAQTFPNPRFPHRVRIWREERGSDAFEDTVDERVLYDGVGRSFTNTTTTGDDHVVMNTRKCALPVLYDQWVEPVLAGDRIMVETGGGREWGEVTDFEPSNFGSEVYWHFVRN